MIMPRRIDEHCIEKISYKKIVLKENRSTITFENPRTLEVEKIKVDGCAIKNSIKCDFMLIPENLPEHYIELKGKDIKHALQQITETINKLSKVEK